MKQKRTLWLCPHCGTRLFREIPGTTRDEYPLYCDSCDENFFEVECRKLPFRDITDCIRRAVRRDCRWLRLTLSRRLGKRGKTRKNA